MKLEPIDETIRRDFEWPCGNATPGERSPYAKRGSTGLPRFVQIQAQQDVN
jgi:hypothetical protein